MMENRGIYRVVGVSDSRTALVISELMKKNGGRTLILTATGGRANSLADDLSFFEKEKKITIMPEEDQVFLQFEAKSNKSSNDRLRALSELRRNPEAVVIAPVSAAVKKVIPHTVFDGRLIRLSVGDDTDLTALREDLVELGYIRRTMVEVPGDFSFRGGILDIYPADREQPCRIEFFDTEVDSIRSFDIDTQRSTGNLREIEIGPASQMLVDPDLFRRAADKINREYTKQAERLLKKGEEFSEAAESLEKRRDSLIEYVESQTNVQLLENYLHYFYDSTEYLWDYMEKGNIFVEDPDRITEYLEVRRKELREDFTVMIEKGQVVPKDTALITGPEDFRKVYERRPLWIITPFMKAVRGIERCDQIHDFRTRQMASFNGKLDVLEQEIASYINKDYEIHITASSEDRLRSLRDEIERAGLRGKIYYDQGVLSQGMDFPEQKLCYISENDIFTGQKKTRRRKKHRIKGGQAIDNFTDLKEGDFVVHENHGIGKFLGIRQVDVDGQKKDYLKIKYAGSDLLYVPVEQFDIVQKYIGNEERAPKLNKLSGTEWQTAKAKARGAIREMAGDLIRLYAERKMNHGYAFSPDSVWQKEFEDSFPYEETDDQLTAAAEIKRDMEKPVPMDRLLCGDVGFGKTEVAARALFKCLIEGKQAAVLVPTTLLANQHYLTLQERFRGYPFRVEMLSRFRSTVEQKKIVKELSEGTLDLVIGTHRLLSDDVSFRDLGLLVVDEEQRFGVEHKEKIKKFRKNVDVLTLSATPIPRTLNMSLTGIRDMSLITEPPEDRYPIQTYVMEQDDAVIREAILREIDRGGQVFVVYNRVRGISQAAQHIRTLVPEASVIVGHGRMNEHTLEDVMLSFVNKESDVLVATTIIENGLDIRNANTMIVLDADRFGLSQLYQIRGRVGRSNRMAYAYLMYQKDKVLTDVAQKRLSAIREFTEFGSGFKVAMRDLEIRGAGNLLGSEQSGYIMNIGYELYCKLVDEEVKKLQGVAVNENPEDSSVELTVSANIPNWYIDDQTVKLDMYKKISGIRSEAQEDEMLDELVDRFGDVPKETMNLIKVSRIRGLAEDLSIQRIYEQSDRIVFTFAEKNGMTPEGILRASDAFGGRLFVHGGTPPFVRIPLVPKRKLEDSIKLLVAMKGDQNAVQTNHPS
jgi:transcription-repair coupling factor (superfamily II helicase)